MCVCIQDSDVDVGPEQRRGVMSSLSPEDDDMLRKIESGQIKLKCGIKHGFGDQTCIRELGHEGNCRCKAERGSTGTITYSEWKSKDGKFYSHVGYRTIYSKNAVR